MTPHWLRDHPDTDVQRAYRDLMADPGNDGIASMWCDTLVSAGEEAFAEFVRAGLELGAMKWDYGERRQPLIDRQLALFAAVGQHRVPRPQCDGSGKHSHSGRAGQVIHGILHESDPRKPHHHHDEKCGSGFAIVDKTNGQAWFADPLGGECGVKCGQCNGAGSIGHARNKVKLTCDNCVNGRVVADLMVQVSCVACKGGGTYPTGTCVACGSTLPITYTVTGGCRVAVACTVRQFVGVPCGRCEGRGCIHNPKRPGCTGCCRKCHGHGFTGGIAATLFSYFPVAENGVTLTGISPADRVIVNGMTYWFRDVRGENGSESHLPDVLFDLLPGGTKETIGLPFDAATLATAALSRAAWRLGRKRAGLENVT